MPAGAPKFGGEIYKTNGSHGCINTPTDIMSELYDMVEIGTPVIMLYYWQFRQTAELLLFWQQLSDLPELLPFLNQLI